MPLANYCGNSQILHCYGIENWYGAWGAQTTIKIVPLNCNYSSGCDFIDNEMWLNQYNNNQCSAYQNTCWVETGYWNDPFNQYTESYFWADERPGSTLYVHFLGDIPTGDYNAGATFVINADCGSGCFDVEVAATKENYYAQSTNNSMNPTGVNSSIQIGMELAGQTSNAASANPAYYTYNKWLGSIGWEFQTNVGINNVGPSSDEPPWMHMPIPPKNGNLGGEFYTDCCSSTSHAQSPSRAFAPHPNGPGIPALTPQSRQQNGAMFDTTTVSTFVRGHPMPRTLRIGSSKPAAIQKIVFAKSQDISKLLDGENLGVPSNTLLCYVQMRGTFEFPTPSRGGGYVSDQGVEVFDATTGNLILAGA